MDSMGVGCFMVAFWEEARVNRMGTFIMILGFVMLVVFVVLAIIDSV